MNVSLTPELERFIQDKVSAGLYRSASEVVREGLRLLHEQEHVRDLRREQLRSMLDDGILELDSGKGIQLNRQLVADVKASGRARRGKQ